MQDIHNLSHTKSNCKYHIVFTPKYRRKAFLWEQKLGNRSNIKGIVLMERSKYTGNRDMNRSCIHVRRDTAKDECVKFHGISKRKEQPNDIWEAGKFQVQI